MMKRRGAYILPMLCLLCLPCLLLTACAGRQVDTAATLEKLMESAPELPDGTVYRSDAEEGSEAYLSPDMIALLYGEKAVSLFEQAEEYAVYLSSFATPYEIVVFRAYSANDAERLAQMCRDRIEELRVALRGSEWEDTVSEAQVICRGRTVTYFSFAKEK